MMNIFLVCVNYNSYKELNRFLQSIERAYQRQYNMNLVVCIADNSEEKKTFELNQYSFKCQCYLFDNVGYMGAATRVFDEQQNIHKYDYVIISNVDLEVDVDFFINLPLCNDDSIAWISPSILSSFENRDKGLGLAQRPLKTKLCLLLLIYKYPWLLHFVENTIYKRKSLSKKSCKQEKTIYSGHGSFIVLTKFFFKAYSRLQYPMFLFGEELFLGELIRLKGMRVVYNPALKIYDSEHVSTSLLPSKFSCKCNYDSISFILNTFYK